MTEKNHVRVGVVGCGNIAGRYVETMISFPEIQVVGVTDLDRAKGEALAANHGLIVFDDLQTLLTDQSIDVVVNLAIHSAHYEVNRQCLEAGKHVYSEKPLAMTFAEANELVELAKERGLRLACSPFTFLGEAQQTVWKWIRDGKLGTVRLAYAEMNHGRIETWHPAPEPFYQVGPLFDVGVYPLTMLTTIFGPARQVSAYGRVIYPDRITIEDRPFRVETPDFVTATVELASGCLARLTTNFYVRGSKQSGIEFHGDLGLAYLADTTQPGAAVEYAKYGDDFTSMDLLRPANPLQWGLGVRELAQSILADRPHRVTGEQAAHVVEILEAVTTAMPQQKIVTIQSDFVPPSPFDWAL